MFFSKNLVAMTLLVAASIWTTASAQLFSGHPANMESIFTNEEMNAEVDLEGGRELRRRRTVNVDLNVTNIAFQQPFGPFFVMVHNRKVDPLFILGKPASAGLQDLAENGSPDMLVEMYENDPNVLYAAAVGETPTFLGDMLTITVPVAVGFTYVSIASMCLNTNDCFVALNGQPVQIGSFASPGYDSGTEQNNELCSSVPGPACPAGSGNVASGNGEGYVHIHRGFFGLGNVLTEQGYDWRNPMMLVDIGLSQRRAMKRIQKLTKKAKNNKD